eukprot:scaffold3626_cov69-Skeletonema_dohrnii-CCMP3373.AAC.7
MREDPNCESVKSKLWRNVTEAGEESVGKSREVRHAKYRRRRGVGMLSRSLSHYSSVISSSQLTIMRSPSIARLLLIGCVVLLFPEAAFGKLFPLYKWTPPPTASPTSSPSYQPSLRPSLSLQPSLSPSTIHAASSIISSSFMRSNGTSIPQMWWVLYLLTILLCFIGVVFLLDKKKRKMLAKELAEEPTEGPAPTEEPTEGQEGGWSAWLPPFWPGKSSSQPANPPPPVEPPVEKETLG